MPFLALNGIPVPVAEGRRRQVNIGTDSRAFSGAYRLGRRAVRQEWEFKTVPLSPEEALALRGLIAGDGHALAFDGDAFTSRGLNRMTAVGTTFQGARFGGGLNLAVGASAAWAMQLGERWTALHHVYSSAAGAWLQVINRSDGRRWTQGVPLASAGGLSVVSGSLAVTGATNVVSFDDVVGLPFEVPDTWVPHLVAWHTARAWSALPFLVASGGFLPTDATVLGEVRDGEFVEFSHNGSRVVGERLEFTLREV
ncbi:hypothetical protein FJV41_28750 [Myxococcus llanfairpwllgwyngyllgogerychwyrndrobwllllantysiliogogogochensis]|uniref:Uncharacterized protein n=1 Tax=Myxococcus llanfairpwllgwyngyllgogerychwyrndrobwllllantysiliogogogochensis TaxID=2590453 RepID=A0A540WTZ7_9BACT|nr:hypothetical protein [Myxococcus llanfairpwllgwyngyllgogerychwyrndrobwllllantysiliogogogochensis]TQF12476.1 hypothetical protein FJV41_28750 [Myxococcus llanfairpwllgwyngyllgogerychwyrndrobwllllantysiliogogogochensis]